MTTTSTDRSPAGSTDDAAAIFGRLRELANQCEIGGVNRNDAGIALITACIEEGFDTRPRIVGALKALGFDRGHIAILLKEETGADPRRHRWAQDDEGRSRCHLDGGDG